MLKFRWIFAQDIEKSNINENLRWTERNIGEISQKRGSEFLNNQNIDQNSNKNEIHLSNM